MAEEHKILSTGRSLAIGFAVGAIVTGLLMWMLNSGTLQNVDVEVAPGRSIKVALQGGKVNDTILLNTLWQTQFTQDGMLGWLRHKGVFALNDPALKEGIQNMTNPEAVIEAIKSLEDRARKAFVSVPMYAVPKDTAYVWKNSPFKNKVLTFVNDSESVQLRITCIDGRGAKKVSDTSPDASFHLNIVDFEKLIGTEMREGHCWVTVN